MFIEVTTKNGKPLLVNVGHIRLVSPAEPNQPYCKIELMKRDGVENIVVSESYIEIRELLKSYILQNPSVQWKKSDS